MLWSCHSSLVASQGPCGEDTVNFKDCGQPSSAKKAKKSAPGIGIFGSKCGFQAGVACT